MAKVLVKVKIGDDENKDFNETVQVEINSIDYVVIKDNMESCSCEEFDTSWDRLVRAIERQTQFWLSSTWYIKGGIEFVEKIY
jgi:hypothetical protein